MFHLLKRIPILQRNTRSTEDSSQSDAKRCSYLAIGVNLCLVIVKLFCGLASGSVSIIADGVNNLTDVLMAIMTWIGFEIAGVGAGAHHPFGHGRFEWVMGAASGVMILFIGAQTFIDSIKTVQSPKNVEFSFVMVTILLVSIIAKFMLYRYDKKINKKINSVALMAAAEDSKNDSLSTSMILMGMILQQLVGINVDGWCGMAVSGIIMIGGFKTVDEAVERILGTSPNEELTGKIMAVARKYPQIHNISKLHIHDYGMGHIAICMNIVGTDNEQLISLTNAAHEIEERLYQELGCDMTIQVDIVSEDEQE